jgi:hypothetical protein
MTEHLSQAGLADSNVVMDAYDTRTQQAVLRLIGELPSEEGTSICDEVSQAVQDADRERAALFEDHDGAGSASRGDTQGRSQMAGNGIVPQDEEEDAEHPAHAARNFSRHMQKVLQRHVDTHKKNELLEQHREAQQQDSLDRINNLSHPETDHDWLWALNRNRSPVVDAEEYVEAVRARLGCAGLADRMPCGRCGAVFSIGNGSHASCCSLAEATRGHHCISRFVFDQVKTCDPAA